MVTTYNELSIYGWGTWLGTICTVYKWMVYLVRYSGNYELSIYGWGTWLGTVGTMNYLYMDGVPG